MAKKDKKKQSKIKVKKKTWFKVVSPSIFGMKEIGETYLDRAEQAIDRVMKVNLKSLTGSMKDQNIHISLKIKGTKGQVLQTSTVGYQVVPTYIKRVVRKRTSRLDNVFRFTNKAGEEMIVKTLIVTLNRNKRSTGATIRETVKDLLQQEISKNNFENFVNSLVTLRTQLGIKKKLNKIYPVKEVVVRSVKLVDGKGKTLVVDQSEEVADSVEGATETEETTEKPVVKDESEESTETEEENPEEEKETVEEAAEEPAEEVPEQPEETTEEETKEE